MALPSSSRRDRPILRPGIAVIPMAGAVQLRAGDEQIHVIRTDQPDLVTRLISQLDGRHDRAALVAWAKQDNEPLVEQLMRELADRGLLLDEPIDDRDEVSRYLAHWTERPRQAASELRNRTVLVLGHDTLVELFNGCLHEHGIGRSVIGPEALEDGRVITPPDTVVCLWEQPDLAMVLKINDAVCHLRWPCLFADLSHGGHATIGPFFLPGDGSCYRCFRSRLHENTAAHEELAAADRAMEQSGRALPPYGTLPAHRYQVAGLACGEVAAMLCRHRPLRTLNRAITVDLEQVEMIAEPVWRVPWCPSCGAEP